MKKVMLLLALVALVCWIPAQALATPVDPGTTFDSILGVVGSHQSAFDDSLTSYGTVHVALDSLGTTATITMTPLGESPKDFDFVPTFSVGTSTAISYSAFLNVNADPSTFDEAAAGLWASWKVGVSPDGLGTFNLAASNQLVGSVEQVILTLTRTSGSWADASQVLILNAAGFDAGVWLFEHSADGRPRGYVGEVPVPASVLLFGTGLLGLVPVWRLRRQA